MTERRPDIPRPLEREVLVEAGHRCAIPQCRSLPVEIAHIDPYAKVKEHRFENLIALCANCHALHHAGKIDRLSLIAYKRNLSILNHRYTDTERRLLEIFARRMRDWDETKPLTAMVGGDRSFDFIYLIADRIIDDGDMRAALVDQDEDGREVEIGIIRYALLPAGVELVRRLVDARELDA